MSEARSEALRAANVALYARLLQGDLEARSQFIDANRPLCISRAEAFVKRRPSWGHLLDDLISENYLNLIKFARSGRSVTDVQTYLLRCFDHAMDKYVVSQGADASRPGRKSRPKRRNQGEVNEPSSSSSTGNSEFLAEGEIPDQRNDVACMELLEMIEACCKTPTELKVIRLRQQGATDAEIARSIGLSDSAVNKARRLVEHRFNDRMAALAL